MTDEEIEKQADDYEMNCPADVYRDEVCRIPYAYSAQKLEQAHKDGAKWGMEKICETCAQRLKELGKPCAFRSLGNEHCWELAE